MVKVSKRSDEMKLVKMKLSEIVLDFELYPRTQVDSTQVRHLKDAIEAGENLPPMIIDGKSKRGVDGFHRHKAYMSVLGPDAEIEVELRSYKNDAELFSDAMQLNARHGNTLSPYDRVRCINRAEALGLTIDQVSGVLGLTVTRVEEIRLGRSAISSDGVGITLKATARHLKGKKVTKKQIEANKKAGGMNAAFYVNQVINLIEGDLIDWEQDYIAQRFTELKRLMTSLDIAGHRAA